MTEGPQIAFHPVTPDRLPDLERFADAHGKFRWCACMRFRLASSELGRSTAAQRLDGLVARVRAAEPVGVLAYADGVPVGWCSVAPRERHAALERSRTLARIDERPVWSIVCFFVDRHHRRRGMTEGLLRAAVRYAFEAGAETVEGYPVEPGPRSYTYMGAPSVFERVGFRDVTPPGRKRRVVRIDRG